MRFIISQIIDLHFECFYQPYLWRKLLPRFWTQSSELAYQLHWSQLALEKGSSTSCQICIHSILTFSIFFKYSRGLARNSLHHKRVILHVLTCIEGSSCRLYYDKCTIVSVAALAESRDFLSVGDHWLEDLFGMQISFCQGMLKSNCISAAKLMILLTTNIQ